ncbi:kinesin-like protein, putative [Bodo saltans]|uniref:Kinesin-like protein n=1 Tax=Bodo saltans TaxID=75058 RepID=A0A0S4JXY6_BODSA|nr:kinesin-like protein, putative [Bodo saltans]|eukprot:CUG94281.1 kinesin-like protein, putative [Bodo saltans]
MTERVVVACRVRPPLSSSEAKSICVTPVDDQRVCVGGHRIFSVDRVYDVSCGDELIFRERVAPLIEGFLVGYNTTIMAFGQTGAGKTHTMNSISPLVVEVIAQHMGGLENISFQLLEVYGEVLHDLLALPTPGAATSSGASPSPHNNNNDMGASPAPPSHSKPLQLLEGQTQTHVVGASRVKARTLEEARTILDHGYRARATGATAMNAASSRSHSILTIFNHHKLSKLHLVDLAGSERNKKTHNVGVRFKESIGINTGLLALGNVIRALSKNSTFIPYRASKLTRLLQDSLGGNSRTLFLACVAPDSANLDETIRTLQYSSKAMHVLNEPLPNMDVIQAEQQQQIRRMQAALDLSSDEVLRQYANGDEFAAEQGAEIQRLTGIISELEIELRGTKLELKKDETIFATQLKEIRRLNRDNEHLHGRVGELEHQVALLQREKDQLSQQQHQQQHQHHHHYGSSYDDAPDGGVVRLDDVYSSTSRSHTPPNQQQATTSQQRSTMDSELLRRAIPGDAMMLGKSAMSATFSYQQHLMRSPSVVVGEAHTPPSSSRRSASDHFSQSAPYQQQQQHPHLQHQEQLGDISYVNLYSANTSAPSLFVQPTPASKVHHGQFTLHHDSEYNIPTAARPSVAPTPHTGHHVIPLPTPHPTTTSRSVAPQGISAVKPIGTNTPGAKILFTTPPSKRNHFDATDEVHAWTNTLAERLATEDSVLFPTDSPPPSLKNVVVNEYHDTRQRSAALRNSPLPRNGPLFASQSTGPAMSSILQSSPPPLGAGPSASDAQIHELLAAHLHHSSGVRERNSLGQATHQVAPHAAPSVHFSHNTMHLQLDRLLKDHDVLREENASMRRELQKIQEMISQC